MILLLQPKEPYADEIMLWFYILVIGPFLIFMAHKVFIFFEMAYVEYIKKQLFFNHVYVKRNHLAPELVHLLRREFLFYQKLHPNHKEHFEHRVAYFINSKTFIGKGIEVTSHMKLLIAATAAKLTFGLRDYKLQLLDKVLIYPDTYFSGANAQYHKGEFNPAYGALVLSWQHVLEGYATSNDNVNLAVHEMVHAMHINYLKRRHKSTSAAIFLDSFNELMELLNKQPHYKNRLVRSHYLRDYAHTNAFEFAAVLIEHFIETPKELKQHFPEVYHKVRQMLNFNFYPY
jgi:Mlc titration factor MtfA (ptsG expression regulator)